MKNNQTFWGRQTKAGTYTTVITLVLLAVLVVVNLFVGALPKQYTVIDTTANDLYTLTEGTETSVKAIREPITLYYITTPSSEDAQLTTFLERFSSLNSLIALKKIDPTTHPTFLDAYTTDEVSENSVIVESERRFKLVDYFDIYLVEITDYMTYLQSGGAAGVSFSFAGESAITGALDFVTTDKLPTIYQLTGHGESELPATLATQLKQNNLALESLHLLTLTEMPADADCILINAPTADLQEYEASLLSAYLAQGGHLFLMTDYRFDPAACPNLRAITAQYGIEAEAGVVMEGSSNRYFQYPYFIIPEIGAHEITQELASQYPYVLIPAAHGLTLQENVRSSLNVSPLFTTSAKSFMTQPEGDKVSTLKPEGAEERSFVLGAAASETVDGGETKLVWLSGAQIQTETFNQYVSNGNYAYLQQMIDWMCEREQVITVPPIAIEESMLTVSELSANLIGTVIMAIIPLSFAVFGTVYWLKRRRR